MSEDLTRLTAEELIAAMQADVKPDEETPFDLNEFKGNVLGELNRRMGDKDLVKDIPGTGLIQLAKELLKQPEEEKTVEHDGRSILDSLDAVPREHALMVLDREIERLKGELARFEAKREELSDGA